ncbi:MAG: carboxyl transferase domain-containing protein [Actinomycetota bacterium]
MEAVAHMVDAGSFKPVDDELTTADPLSWPGYREAMASARERSGTDESVRCGPASIKGHDVELAAFDFSFFGGSMGEVAGERIARGLERAASRGVPFVLRTVTGGARMQEGMRSLAQMPKMIGARIEFAASRLPFIAVIGHPTTGGVFASITSLADVTLAEEGATVGFAGPRLVERFTGRPLAGSHTAETALAAGLVDAVVPSESLRATLGHLLDVLAPDNSEALDEPDLIAPSRSDAWPAVARARAEDRPLGPDLLRDMLDSHAVLKGDRTGREDPSVECALGRLAGRRVLAIALDRRMHPGPSAYRKARRCVEFAGRIGIPVVALIDTPGANPSEASENAGIASEIAQQLEAMLRAPVPVVAVVTGEGNSGGALAFGAADVLLAYEGSIFSVIAPESAALILWRDAERAPEAAGLIKLTAPDLVGLGIAHGVLPDPPGAESLRRAVAYHLDRLSGASSSGAALAANRRSRWRKLHGTRETHA